MAPPTGSVPAKLGGVAVPAGRPAPAASGVTDTSFEAGLACGEPAPH
jgi:hypothetical protein